MAAPKGFAAMDKDRHHAIATSGGKAAHAKGTAHEWTADEAREAGRKGGLKAAANRKRMSEPPDSTVDVGADVPGGGAI